MFDHIDCLDMEFINIAADAIRDNRLSFATQTIVSVSTGEVLYSENKPQLWTESGSVHEAPEFMPALEALGESPLVDRHLLRLTLDGLERSSTCVLGCKLSIENFCDFRAYELIREQIVERFSLASRLVLEINQTDPQMDLALFSRALPELRALGCKFALDDFGANHSFRVLNAAHFEIVKVDHFFMNPKAPSLSETKKLADIIATAKGHADTIVVDGILTPAQKRCAEIAGATHIQNIEVPGFNWLH